MRWIVLAAAGAAVAAGDAASAQDLGQMLRNRLQEAVRAQRQRPNGGSAGRRIQAVDPFSPRAARVNARRTAAAAKADAPVDDSVFLPEHAKELDTYLSARAAVANAMLSDCRDEIAERDVRRGYTPDAAEQIRLGQDGRRQSDACLKQSRDYFQLPLERLRAVLTQWAAAQPASYAGLRAFSKAGAEYNYVWGRSRDMTREVGTKVQAVSGPIFEARIRQIEQAVRPQLMADLRKPGGTALLDDLFLGDPTRRAAYRNQITGEVQAKAQADMARRFAAAGPPNVKVRQAVLLAWSRAPRWQIAQASGMLAVTDTAMAVKAPGFSQDYSFDVDRATCVAAGAGRKKCSYRFRFAASATVLGVTTPPADSGWIARTDTFSEQGGMLRSTALDQAMADAAAAGASQQSYSSSSDTSSTPYRDPIGSINDFNDTMCHMGSDSYC